MAANTKVVLENTIDGYLAEGTMIKGGYAVVADITNITEMFQASIVTGSMVYNKADGKLYTYTGEAWAEVQTGGGGIEVVDTVNISMDKNKILLETSTNKLHYITGDTEGAVDPLSYDLPSTVHFASDLTGEKVYDVLDSVDYIYHSTADDGSDASSGVLFLIPEGAKDITNCDEDVIRVMAFGINPTQPESEEYGIPAGKNFKFASILIPKNSWYDSQYGYAFIGCNIPTVSSDVILSLIGLSIKSGCTIDIHDGGWYRFVDGEIDLEVSVVNLPQGSLACWIDSTGSSHIDERKTTNEINALFYVSIKPTELHTLVTESTLPIKSVNTLAAIDTANDTNKLIYVKNTNSLYNVQSITVPATIGIGTNVIMKDPDKYITALSNAVKTEFSLDYYTLQIALDKLPDTIQTQLNPSLATFIAESTEVNYKFIVNKSAPLDSKETRPWTFAAWCAELKDGDSSVLYLVCHWVNRAPVGLGETLVGLLSGLYSDSDTWQTQTWQMIDDMAEGSSDSSTFKKITNIAECLTVVGETSIWSGGITTQDPTEVELDADQINTYLGIIADKATAMYNHFIKETELINYHDNSKQNIISDIANIRSGASLGATAVQPIKGKGLFSGDYNDLTNKPSLATVALTGSYNDLVDAKEIVVTYADKKLN